MYHHWTIGCCPSWNPQAPGAQFLEKPVGWRESPVPVGMAMAVCEWSDLSHHTMAWLDAMWGPGDPDRNGSMVFEARACATRIGNSTMSYSLDASDERPEPMAPWLLETMELCMPLCGIRKEDQHGILQVVSSGGTSKWMILVGFSNTNQPFRGFPIYGNPQME